MMKMICKNGLFSVIGICTFVGSYKMFDKRFNKLENDILEVKNDINNIKNMIADMVKK